MLQDKVHWIRIATAVLALAGGTAEAKLKNCADPGSPEMFKIFLDEVRVAGVSAGDAKVQARLQSIHKFLLENLRASAGDNGSVRECGPRYPQDPSGSDFDSTEFDTLDNSRVVLEVWGVMDDAARESGSLGFALIPAHSMVPPAVYTIASANLLSSLRQGKRMGAFAPLVFGIRHFQNRNYAGTVPLLCAGTQQLSLVLAGQAGLADAAFVARQQDLLKKVKEITDKAIKEARRVPGSVYGALTAGSDGSFACPQ